MRVPPSTQQAGLRKRPLLVAVALQRFVTSSRPLTAAFRNNRSGDTKLSVSPMQGTGARRVTGLVAIQAVLRAASERSRKRLSGTQPFPASVVEGVRVVVGF